jgi:DNA-directed RNA polymerase subunit RPC12/RpoP
LGSQTNSSSNQTDQCEDDDQNEDSDQCEATDQNDLINHTVHTGNEVRCPYCGKELSPLASSLSLQLDKLSVDYQTQCSFCGRKIYKKDITAAEPKKKKFWQIWK